MSQKKPPPLIDTKEKLQMALHPYQMTAYKSRKRITALISGIQGGKTRVGGIWMMRQIAMFDFPQQNFIIAAPTFKLMEKSTLPWALHLLRGCGKFDRTRYKFHLNGGGTIWFCSMQDDDSAEGATNVRAIWIDEAGKIRYNSWINLLARSSFLQAPIFITTTPYSMNWLYHDIYKPWTEGKRQDVEIVQFRSCDNPYFPKVEYEMQKKALDHRVFQRKYGGTFERMGGLVYMDFDERNYSENFSIDANRYHLIAGVDLGFENPFAITVRAIGFGLGNKYDYQIDEYCKSYLGPVQKVNVARHYQELYPIETWYIDSAEPDMIEMFNNAGLHAEAVVKGPGSVQHGIELHQELIKTKKYRLFNEKCPQTIKEYETYHYKEDDGKAEKNPDELPVPIYDHLMDANRYVTMMTQHLRDDWANQERPPLHVSDRTKLLSTHDEDGDWYND